MDNRYTRGLADFGASLTYSAIPAEVRERLKHKLTAHALPKQRIADLRDAVLGLDKLPDAAKLAALMAQP